MTNALNMEVVGELLSLTGDDDPELLLDLIGMFLDDAPERVLKMETAFAAGDMEALAEVAHTLKGSAGNLGVTLLQDDCDTLQVAGRKNNAAAVGNCMPTMKQHFDEAMAALRELRSQYESSPGSLP